MQLGGLLVHFPIATAAALLGLVISTTPEEEQEQRAYQWFVDYVKERDTTGMLK